MKVKLKTPCPSCKKLLKVKEKHIGRQIKCPNCQEKFTVSKSSLIRYERKKERLERESMAESTNQARAALPKEKKKIRRIFSRRKKKDRNRVLSGEKKLPREFLANMLIAPAYPLTGISTLLILVFTYIFFETTGMIIRMVAMGVIGSILFEIVANAGIGKPELQVIHDFDYSELHMHVLKMLSALLYCAWPTLAYLLLCNNFNGAYCLLFSLPGLFLFPMVFLAVSQYDFSGLQPIRIICPITQLFLPYLMVCAIFYGLIAAGIFILVWVITHWRGADLFVLIFLFARAFIFAYFGIIAMRVLGGFYWSYQGKFGWAAMDKAERGEGGEGDEAVHDSGIFAAVLFWTLPFIIILALGCFVAFQGKKQAKYQKDRLESSRVQIFKDLVNQGIEQAMESLEKEKSYVESCQKLLDQGENEKFVKKMRTERSIRNAALSRVKVKLDMAFERCEKSGLSEEEIKIPCIKIEIARADMQKLCAEIKELESTAQKLKEQNAGKENGESEDFWDK